MIESERSVFSYSGVNRTLIKTTDLQFFLHPEVNRFYIFFSYQDVIEYFLFSSYIKNDFYTQMIDFNWSIFSSDTFKSRRWTFSRLLSRSSKNLFLYQDVSKCCVILWYLCFLNDFFFNLHLIIKFTINISNELCLKLKLILSVKSFEFYDLVKFAIKLHILF